LVEASDDDAVDGRSVRAATSPALASGQVPGPVVLEFESRAGSRAAASSRASGQVAGPIVPEFERALVLEFESRAGAPAVDSAATASAASESPPTISPPPTQDQFLQTLPTQPHPEKRYKRTGEGCLDGHIGEGGYGKVYVATDLETGTVVAVKRQTLSQPEAMREFLFHSAVRAMGHPNIMHLRDGFVSCDKQGRNWLYTVFDLMDNNLLALQHYRRGTFSAAETNSLFHCMSAGAAHLHDFNIVHGDISARNVLVRGTFCPDGRIECRLGDLGCAFTASEFVLRPDVNITTLNVRAPEAALGKPKVTEAIDNWALGVHLLSLATRSYVFWTKVKDRDDDKDRANAELLKQMVLLLGAPERADWPEMEQLPRYHLLFIARSEILGAGDRSATDRLMNLDGRILKPMGFQSQPLLPKDQPTIDMILGLLQWNPARRVPAKYVAEKSRVNLGARGTLPPAIPSERPSLAPSTPIAEAGAGGDRPDLGTTPSEGTAHATAARASDPRVCSGNCGAKLCKLIVNRRRKKTTAPLEASTRSRSPGTSSSGALLQAELFRGTQLSKLCKCEKEDCGKPRNHHMADGRWCKQCFSEEPVTPRTPRGKLYRNRYGWHRYNAAWSLGVKLVASKAFVLELVTPLDNVVFTSLCAQVLVDVAPGQLLSPETLVTLFLGHTIKWPVEARHWQQLVKETPPSAPDDFVDHYAAVIAGSSGNGWPTIFHRMNHKRAHATSGLAVNGACLGLLVAEDSDFRTRPEGDTVHLGPALKPYILRQHTSDAIILVTTLLELAKKANVRWPARHDKAELIKFISSIKAFAEKVRSQPKIGDTGFVGGRSPENAYNV